MRVALDRLVPIRADTSCVSLRLHRTPATAAPRPGGVADEGAVDMEERRDQPPPPVTRRPVIPSVAGRLSPVQEAWSDYVRHGLSCEHCRSLDTVRCREAERLHGAYGDAEKAAFQRLADETR